MKYGNDARSRRYQRLVSAAELKPLPMSLKEVSRIWADDHEKTYGPWLVSVEELWAVRDYTWTREKARDGFAYVDGNPIVLSGPLKWDAIMEDMKENGWRAGDLGHVYFGRDGRVKMGEGNHRLAIAKQLGIEMAPVDFHFNQDVDRTSEKSRAPTVLNSKAFKKALLKYPYHPLDPKHGFDKLVDMPWNSQNKWWKIKKEYWEEWGHGRQGEPRTRIEWVDVFWNVLMDPEYEPASKPNPDKKPGILDKLKEKAETEKQDSSRDDELNEQITEELRRLKEGM